MSIHWLFWNYIILFIQKINPNSFVEWQNVYLQDWYKAEVYVNRHPSEARTYPRSKYFLVMLYSAAKNKSSKPHFMYWTAQLHNAILLRKSAEIKKWFDPCSCWSKTSLHTKNQVPSSKKGNFGFLGLSKKVRNVCGKGQKSKNELTHLHVGQKYPFTQEMRSLAQKQSILT